MIWNRIFLHLKGLRLFALVPLILVFIVLPLVFIPLIDYYGATENMYVMILQYSQATIPIFSVWWIIFISREYIENDGNELLFTFKSRIMLPEYLILFAAFMLCTFVLFLILSAYFSSILLEYIRILCICIMYLGFSYAVMYITSSMSLTLLILTAHSMLNLTVPNDNPNLFLYNSNIHFGLSIFESVSLPQIIVGCVLLTVGYAANKKYVRYK